MQYPPTPQRKSCNCSDACISTDDVYYAGPNLPNSGVNTSDLLTEVIEKLDAIYAVPTLQRVTEIDNYTTLPIIADSFVKIGGTGNNILLDNGDVLSIGDLPVGVTKTSELINDGEDGINPFITALDIPTYTSSFINDGGDGLNPYITAQDVIVQIIQVDTFSLLPEIGEYDVVYITLDTYKFYIWEGYYVEVGSSVTNLEYVQGTTNGYINNSNGTSAELLLADETYAGLFSPEEKIKLETIEPYANVGVIPNTPIVGNTNTLITFDDKGLVTSGDNATTDNIIEAPGRRYITDDQQVVLNNTSGTNTGDQNLQQVTDLDATTNNTITLNPITNTNGLNINTTYDYEIPGFPTAINLNLEGESQGININAGGASQSLLINGNGNSSAIQVNNSDSGIYLNNPATGLIIVDSGNLDTAIYIVNANGSYGINTTQNIGTAENINLGVTAKGIVINSGTSSTGNPITVNKNGVDKFTINQQGEQSIVKIPGGTGANVLLDNGTTAALSSIGGSQNLQQVTEEGATTTNGITIDLSGITTGLTVQTSDESNVQTKITATTLAGIAISATSDDGTGVLAFSDNGTTMSAGTDSGTSIYVNKGPTGKGIVVEGGASSTGNVIEFNKDSVNKLTVNSEGATSIITRNQTSLAIISNSDEDDSVGINVYGGLCGIIATGVTNSIRTYDAEVGILAEANGTSVVAQLNDYGSNGIKILSSSSSTGIPFKITKNFVDKLTINQAGELTATKLIKQGGTGLQILAADGSIITPGENIFISGGIISSTGGGGSGGGSSVSYYLNGGTAASVGGYYQFSQSAVVGTGVDFPLTGNGLISQWLTDVGDPNKLEILGGNWNLETYMSVSSSGGSPGFYVELLKYNGTTFTTIANNSATPELITTTAIDVYLSSIAIPQTTLLATDRLVLRYYIVNAGGRTITMHTQDSHLCQVITNFTNGVIYLNGLNASSQNFGIATTGSDFNIISSGSTHTFYLPSASSSNRGALTSADWTTFNNKLSANTLITGATNTKITYDSKGLVTGSAAATTADIAASTNKNYVTDANLTVINNTSGANTGNQTFSNTSDATSHTVTLSTTGGSVKLVEGSGITLTTTGTTANGIITITSTGGGGSGTVTSVAALTLGTTGSDLSSTVANNTTTPVITLNVPNAGPGARGVITAGVQTIAGAKTFSSNPSSSDVLPPVSNNSTLLATTAYVDRQVGTGIPIYNIKITTLAGTSSITTQEPGISDGNTYSQNGRNVMIDNTDPISIVSSGAPDQFIASYTKLTPIGTQDISFSTSGVTVIYPNGLILSGSAGSTALLTKNGTTVYLLINNLP